MKRSSIRNKNGNLTKDLNKNITEIQYNIFKFCLVTLVLLTEVVLNMNMLLQTVVKSVPAYYINDNVTSTVYCGNAVYENGSLKILLNESGYSFPR